MTDQTPRAFWSYAHSDDQHDASGITWLCKRLAGEVRLKTGLLLDVFMDTERLQIGDAWKSRLEAELRSCQLLIPVITPSYFQSSTCHFEYETFRDREILLGRNDLILPIYYAETALIDKPESNSEKWAKDLASRQYFDWRSFRLKSRRSGPVLLAVSRLADQVKLVITNKVEPVMMQAVQFTPRDPDEIVRAFHALGATQKWIISYVYKILHRAEMPLDDLYSAINERQGHHLIGGSAEFFYRIKDLVHLGLLATKPIGPRTTIVMSLPEVGNVLIDKGLIDT